MKESKLGEQESVLLSWIATHAPASVADVITGWGIPNNLARTTVTRMLDRLHTKGYLKREKQGPHFVWSPREEHESQLRSVVGRFVERTLGGSLDPFVAYLRDANLSEEQKEQLRTIVERLDSEPENQKVQA